MDKISHHDDSFGWYAYRLPYNTDFIFGNGPIESHLHKGFAYSPFITESKEDIKTIIPQTEFAIPIENLSDSPLSTFLTEFYQKNFVPSDYQAESDLISDIPQINSHQSSGSENAYFYSNSKKYAESIAEIKNYLNRYNPTGKVVFSRRIPYYENINIISVLNNLAKAYPAAFIFCFNTPYFGTWIGASPETLVEGNKKYIHSMALAGTRAADTDPNREWDFKNQEEHNIVVEYIKKIFSDFNLNPAIGQTFTKKAGPVEHLCTPISGVYTSDFDLVEFLMCFSPTPALCGSAERSEVPLIIELEDTPRELYGGWCGPFADSEYHLFVNLRSAKLFPKSSDLSAMLYSGGGITLKSDAVKEWIETEKKSMTLLRYFK